MDISVHNETERVRATGVSFVDQRLCVTLNDGREISLLIDQVHWLAWLAQAPPNIRVRWSIESGGYAIYWEDLDDGIEIRHLLSQTPLMTLHPDAPGIPR